MARIRKQGNLEVRTKRVLLPVVLHEVVTYLLNDSRTFPVMEKTYKMVCKLLGKPYSHDKELYQAAKAEFNLNENMPKIDYPLTQFNTPDMDVMAAMYKHNALMCRFTLLAGQANNAFRLFKNAGFIFELELVTNNQGEMFYRDEILVHQVDRVGELVKSFKTPVAIEGLDTFKFLNLDEYVSDPKSLKLDDKVKVDMSTISEEMKESTTMDNGVSILNLKEFWYTVVRMIQTSTISYEYRENDMDRIMKRHLTPEEVVEKFENMCPKSVIGKDSIIDRSRIYNSIVGSDSSVFSTLGLEEQYFAIKNKKFDDAIMSKDNNNALVLIYSYNTGRGGFISTTLDKVSDTFGEDLTEIDALRIRSSINAISKMGGAYVGEIQAYNAYGEATMQYDSIMDLKNSYGKAPSPFGSFGFGGGNPNDSNDGGPILN
ncbi:MAG: hypothetical protein ACRC92_27315 [Peptostreptococcaceae bacterium]